MRLPLWIVFAGLMTGIVCILVGTGHLPLGVPGQWEWGRLDIATLPDNYLWTIALTIAYLAIVVIGAERIDRGRSTRVMCLVGLVAGGVIVQSGMQQLGFGLAKWPFVLYSPSSSGYYTAAKRDVQSAQQYLADYPKIQSFYREHYGPLHLATHPPGLVLMQHGLIRLCERSPFLTKALLKVQPQSVADGFRHAAAGSVIPEPDQAALWLQALLSQVASALTVLPIFALARRGVGPRGAWAAAALWPLVPAVTVFMPKSDVLYPLFAATSIASFVAGQSMTGRFLAGFAAGITLWAGMFLSFAMISLAPLILSIALFADGLSRARAVRSGVQRVSGIITAFGLASSLLWLFTGHNVAATWWRCFVIHGEFYDAGQVGASRTYWPWVVYNPFEFAVAAGIPLMVAAVGGAARRVQNRRAQGGSDAIESKPGCYSDSVPVVSNCPSCLIPVVAGWWLTLVLLDLTGKNLGEIARLWMLLMPFACVAAAALLDRIELRRLLAIVVLLQAIQTATLTANIQGFFDPSSIGILEG
jgi:hypothetical protein